MILVWNNIDSFRQHLEEMRLFRESHNHGPHEALSLLKNMPVYKMNPLCKKSLTRNLFDEQYKLQTIPLWNITLTEGTQN